MARSERGGEKGVLQIAVCDDERAAADLIAGLARDWARGRGVEAHVDTFASADALFFSLDDGAPDVALLDIEMPGASGMELARLLRERGERTQVVFVTGIIDHVFDGYDVDAVSYLLKPARADRLFLALDRARERLGRAEPVLVVESAGETSRVAVSRVCYVEGSGHDALVHLADGTCLRSKEGLARVEAELAGESTLFTKCHRSYLVNLAHVRRITRRDVEMDDGASLPIARGRWEPLNRAWLAWCRGTLG